MNKFRFTIELVRDGSELRMTETRCEMLDTNGSVLWVSPMSEGAAGDTGSQSFPYTKPARALLLLLLRDLPMPASERFGLVGVRGSHAASLHEVIVRAKDKKGEKNWLLKMFTNPEANVQSPLGTRLFRRGLKGGRFSVRLGPDWEEAKVTVKLGRNPVGPARYAALAKLVERSDAPSPSTESLSVPLTARLEMFVRDPGTGCFEKPSLLPLKSGDEVQIHATLNRRAYMCLAWVDQMGRPFAMYPWTWTEAGWSEDVDFLLKEEITVPDTLSPAGHSDLVVRGRAGVETLVLMVSEDIPSAETLKALPVLLRVRPPDVQPRDLRGPVMSGPLKVTAAPVGENDTRTPGRRKGGDPVEEFQAALARALAARFDCVALLTFANAGVASGVADSPKR